MPSPIVKAEAKEITAIGGGGGGIHSTTHDDIAAGDHDDDSGSVGSGGKRDGGFNNGSQVRIDNYNHCPFGILKAANRSQRYLFQTRMFFMQTIILFRSIFY